MTEEFLRKSTKNYFARRNLLYSPCSHCSNFVASAPETGGKPFSCTVMKKSEMQKYFCPDAPTCPMLQEGEMQIIC